MPASRFLRSALLTCLLLAVGSLWAEAPYQFYETPGKLPKILVPINYDITLELHSDTLTTAGSERVTFTATEDFSQITLNSHELEIDTAVLRHGTDQLPLKISLDAEQELLHLASTIEFPAGEYSVVLTFRGKIGRAAQGLFVDRYLDPAGTEKMLIGSQMEATDARRVFPCWDEPAFRATFDLTLIAPPGFNAYSNMPAIDRRDLGDGRQKVTFTRSPVMSTYLVAIYAGEIEEARDSFGDIELGLLTTAGKSAQGRYALDATKSILGYFYDYFGEPYPLPKLDQIAVPNAFSDFGAMENWGLITYQEDALLFDPATTSHARKQNVFETVAHEVAHQWFGNLVTMAWWDNLWLNEGFASWLETKATNDLNPDWQTWLRASRGKERAFSLDARRSTHPIQQVVENESQAFAGFDSISYEKGQAFLRMLENHLGEDVFRAGIRRYISQHKFSNTTTADLWAALSETSGEDVASFASVWTTTPGFPLVSVSLEARGDARQLRLRQHRFSSGEPFEDGALWPIPVTFAPVDAMDQVTKLLFDQAEVVVPLPPGTVAIKANVAAVGYYRVAYGPTLAAALRESISQLPVDDQLNLLNDNWALVDAGEADLTRYLNLATHLIQHENPLISTQIIDVIDKLIPLVEGEPIEPAFLLWEQQLLRPLLARLTWTPQPGESPLNGTLRAKVISQLSAAEDSSVIATAREKFAAYLADPSSLPADLIGPVFNTQGRYADQADYDQLLAMARSARSTQTKSQAFSALREARNPTLARQTMELALDPTIPISESAELVRRVSQVRGQRDAAVTFALAHLDALLALRTTFDKFDVLPEIYRAFPSQEKANELLAVTRERLPGDALTIAQRTAELMRSRATFKARVMPTLEKWLDAQVPREANKLPPSP